MTPCGCGGPCFPSILCHDQFLPGTHFVPSAAPHCYSPVSCQPPPHCHWAPSPLFCLPSTGHVSFLSITSLYYTRLSPPRALKPQDLLFPSFPFPSPMLQAKPTSSSKPSLTFTASIQPSGPCQHTAYIHIWLFHVTSLQLDSSPGRVGILFLCLLCLGLQPLSGVSKKEERLLIHRQEVLTGSWVLQSGLRKALQITKTFPWGSKECPESQSSHHNQQTIPPSRAQPEHTEQG